MSSFITHTSNDADFLPIAVAIQQSPLSYQECCGCEAIVSRAIHVCPFCTAYRFDRDATSLLSRVNLAILKIQSNRKK